MAMDFGDILDTWNASKGRSGRGALPAGECAPLPETRRSVDPLTAWLRIHGVVDKDSLAQDEGESSEERRRRLRNKRADAVVDLHGLSREEAWDHLQSFVVEAYRSGAEKILIIHGKGNHSEGESILKRTTKEFLERCPLTGERGSAPAAQGGAGATWALLKKKGPSQG